MKDIKTLVSGFVGDLDLKNNKCSNKESDYSHLYPKIEIDERSAQVINYVLERLSGMIPAFKYAADNDASRDSIRREYTYAIIDGKITDIKLINLALDKIRRKNLIYLPSPQTFVDMCTPSPEELGMPSVEKAYEQACRNSHPCETDKKWAHEAIELAWRETGSFNLRTEPKTKTFPLFQRNYAKACKDFAEGKIMARIANPKMTQEELQERAYWGKEWKG